MDVEKQSTPAQQPRASTDTLFKASVIVLLACILGVQTIGMWRAATVESEFRREWEELREPIKHAISMVKAVQAASTASVRLVNGNVASMSTDLLGSDFGQLAFTVKSLGDKVFTAMKNINNEATQAAAPWASEIASIANQFVGLTPVVRPPHPTAGDDTPQLTGQGGLLFELLEFTTDWAINQTSPGEWADLGTSCTGLVSQLNQVDWSGKYSCPNEDGSWGTCTWSVNQTNFLPDVQSVCAALQSMPSALRNEQA